MSEGMEECVEVAGIQLPRVGTNNAQIQDAPSFVYEKDSTSYHNLQQLAIAVSCFRPVLLQGPVGSGKTSTVEYLAYLTGHKLPHSDKDLGDSSLFLKVQLGEQTDARMLLGGYQCTEIPGHFVWKPGVLTQAVTKGYWLLLEDIDCTSSDVITVIDSLVKTQLLCVPGYSDNIIPHSQFQLFATQRTLRHEANSGVKSNVLKHWITIHLNSLSKSDIIYIINQKYPKLTSIASRIVSVLDVDYAVGQPNIRIASVRDILKWCNRCHDYFKDGDPESALRIFHDAVDIFCGFMEKDLRFTAAEQIGFKLGIVKNKANFLSVSYKPSVSVTKEKFMVGRACLERKEIDNIVLAKKLKKNVFSLTAQTCCLLEKINCCLECNEPVLLVGETGCGKTTVLQFIANTLGKTLIVINMNQQSDTADLVGGFKPVTFKWIMKPLCEKFELLFRSLFDPEKNAECLIKFSKLVKKQNWDVLMNFIIHVQKKALGHINKKIKVCKGEDVKESDAFSKWENRLQEWLDLGRMIDKYSKQRQAAEKSLVFSFIEGSLVSAMKQGHWVLLDEINLANSETLDCLSGLLEDARGSISLLEKGDSKPVYRDPGFRLFAAMNPATDVGKKQLPIGLRNRFTELFIDELENENDLLPLVESYLLELSQTPKKLLKIVKFYLKVKKDCKSLLLDGNGRKPHYSLRNLCRALMITAKNPCGSTPRSLYEALSVSFLTQLDNKSYKIVNDLIIKAVTESDIKSLLNQPIPKPSENGYINIEGFWLPVGTLRPVTPDNYILTPTVQRHFRDLIKIVSLASGIPVLLEGDTSVGKTSLINYLAKRTGNVCSRVNNHEHTDIQEYIGTYVADAQGKLVFKEGILCESMRKGHWLILDELNLAPTEVLEALNRVLDDNRELFIPETQVTIKAHEKFLLFATQNPPGLYGGRKELSRAFRNRFIELQFNQIPPDELVTILQKRCQMPLSYCKKMVNTMTDLQLRRRGSDIFIGKSGFITLRDLFRWGERYQKAEVEAKFHDWDQHLADEGYILLAGRVRVQSEAKVIEEVLSKYFKRKTTPDNLFTLHENTSDVTKHILKKLIHYSNVDEDFKHIVWTYSMRRLAVLVCKALNFSEPVLIVGETGCGKTSVVQLLARMRQQELYSVNCHMHSESADFLGGLRPVRNESRSSGKLFEWCDGPLIQAMNSGSFFLADEISLADDSVLERLNSLLEPERTILLAEKGGGLIENEKEDYVTVANENFQFIGTMNPGGDYGKKELSPALRNRFTEIWADTTLNKFECYAQIIQHNLKLSQGLSEEVSIVMTNFLKWFQDTGVGGKIVMSIRDILTWVNFMNSSGLKWFESCVHGVCLTFLDGLGSGSGFGEDFSFIKSFKDRCIDFLVSEIVQLKPEIGSQEFLRGVFEHVGEFCITEEKVGIHPFYIQKGKWSLEKDGFVFSAPTTFANARRLLRGLKTNKAILLEGSPGVGKTSLVSSLARASGYKLARINLSDQTDISDLFGADLPDEGGTAGYFSWKDGPFLTALKEGQWILLDELNLASQSVLEGLNAVLDHRGSVYIPELNKTFYVSTETRLFGCQNPLKEGGNRRGLPKSFLNRFTQVYVEPLTEHDYVIILNKTFPSLSLMKIKGELIINLMIKFNADVCKEVAEGRVGVIGGPWELNLRDMTRWAEGVVKDLNLDQSRFRADSEENILRAVYKYMNLLYLSRFRNTKDRVRVYEIYVSYFGDGDRFRQKPQIYLTKKALVFGDSLTDVNNSYFFGDLDEFEMFAKSENKLFTLNPAKREEILTLCNSYQGKRKFEKLRLLEKQYPILCLLCKCVDMNWLTVLVGEKGTGKTNAVKTFAAIKGQNLRIMNCNSAMDTTEILGGFEQTDYNRHLDTISEKARILILSAARRHLEKGKEDTCLTLLRKWKEYRELPINNDSLSATAVFDAFLTRLNYLLKLLNKKDLQMDQDLNNLGKSLTEQLEKVKRDLSSSDCLTFGGKFEWVDSILVKSLNDGSWLLLEDVNLCSNAVLDRLNCLLEPNGSLTIGERGAGADGKLVTIKPHPNFRLFFTLDPKNGTISRAMRNRGVEIYFPAEEEITEWPKLDLLSLLKDSGIEDSDVQKALIELESKCERQNVSTLTSNGFWLAQYIRHGFEKPEAFRKSSKLVYKFIDPELIDELSLRLSFDKGFDISLMRPPLEALLIDPEFERLRQSFGLLNLLSEISKTRGVPSETFLHIFGCKNSLQSPDIGSLMTYNIFHVYLTTSTECARILGDFLPRYIEDSKELKIKDTLMNLLAQFGSRNPLPKPVIKDFPWDTRWYENVHRFFPGLPSDETNRIVALLKYMMHLHPEGAITDSKEMTVEKYSKLVKDGRLEDSFPDEPIVSNFTAFLNDFDVLTLDTLTCTDVKIPEAEAKWFLNIIKWRFRLGQQRKLILLSGGRKKTLNEDTLTLLDLHLSWFLKFILKPVNDKTLAALETLPETLRERYSKFWAMSEKIVSSKNSWKLIKISNIFRKRLGHPSPDKYLRNFEDEITAMEIFEPEVLGFQGDSYITRSIFNRIVMFVHLEINSFFTEGHTWENSFVKQFTALLHKLDKQIKHAQQFRKVIEQFTYSKLKEKHKMTAEIMYLCLKTLNSDYDFAEEVNETSENAYLKQVLPFHRAVWTTRILEVVFNSENSWKLSSFRKSQNELCDLMCTVLPNTAFPKHKVERISLMDSRANDLARLSLEINRVIKTVKVCLKIDTDNRGITEVLTEMSEKSNTSLEKIFYTKLNTIVRALVSLKLTRESGLEVVGCFWSLLGLLELLILREGKVDSIRKKLIKADYAKAEVVELETELLALELHAAITGISLNHFYSQNLRQEVNVSKQNLEKYNLLENVQRDPETFRQLLKEIENFMMTFDEGFQFCGSALERAFKQDDTNFADHLFRKLRFIHIKNKQFSATLERNFATHFPDVTYPILAASAQIEHGINIIMSELLCRPFAKHMEVETSVTKLCQFPAPPKSHFFTGFQKINVAAWPKDALKKMETHKLLVLFSSCLAKYNEWLFFKDEYSYNELMAIFSKVVEFWKKEDERKKQEEIEKESLYIKKGMEKCKTTPEDEELLEEQLKLFPTFEEDFNEETPEKITKPETKMGVFSNEQLSQVSRMHMKIVKEYIRTGWCPKSNQNLSPDLVSPVKMRFAFLSQILPHVSYLLNEKVDENLLPGLLVLMNCKESGLCSMEATLLKDENKVYDFYRDVNVEEVSKCLELLQGLNERVKELLDEWPDHPTLNQIKILIERILTFSIDSPVMRFLTGLELVLQCCQHWESVAHSGVSIAEHLIKITNLIIQWRKLELQGWKNCLQAAHDRIKGEAFKWWFHFWCLVEEFLVNESDSPKIEDLLKALYSFIESSPMGEFETRLEILLAYHFHVLRLPESKKRDVLAVALWNLFAFYKQFSKEVAQKLSSEAAPIFKKLKEYVTIAKWHDITYWSVKQAIEKSHKTLVKFIKEYEVVLKRKVELNTFNPTQRDVVKKKKNMSASIDITKYLRNTPQVIEVEELAIQNLQKKLEKARKFSNDIVLTAEYPNLILNLEETVKNICESTQHFAELDVDRSLPEEKRKAQAKNIVHQKRRALADLFKTMQRIGLSYRAGLNESSFDILNLCNAPPMGTLKSERFFDPSGEEYYLKSVFRKQVLENSLLTPSKEIGPPVIERLKGFSNHLMDLNKKQKFTLCKAAVALEKFLEYESAMTSLIENGEMILKQNKFSQEVLRFKDAISESCYLLQQFSHILDSWPLAGSVKLKEMNFLSGEHTPPVLMSAKSDDVYVVTRKQFDDILKEVSNLKLTVEENLFPRAAFHVEIENDVCAIQKSSFCFYTGKHLKMFENCVEKFSGLMTSLKTFSLIFNNESASSQITSCLSQLESFKFTFEGHEVQETVRNKTDFESILKQDVNLLIENILLGIQRLIKKYKGWEENKEGSGADNADDFGELLDNHLDKKLVNCLLADFKDLNLERVNEILTLIFTRLSTFFESENVPSGPYVRILSTAVPFVKQYSLLFSYFVSQQSYCYRASNKLASVLLGTFIQVAQKGYCAPPEFEEDGNGEGWSEKEGGGFTGGEGEGQKDVSDRIESEDQLEDALPQGSEKDKEQEKDCKEEENGIEMSENFDGKAQDVDQKDDDNESDDDDENEEEPDDKEMGETEPGADKLEKEMWSGSEDEDEENSEKKEEKGKGEEINKDKYAAKDENDETDPNGEEQNERQNKEKQKEINEMEEPEDNGDQVDPYHGHDEPEMEPEPLDLPDELQLDEGDVKGDDEQEENPFDIDAMKELQPPKEPEEEKMEEDKPEEKTNEEDSNSEDDETKVGNEKNEDMDVDENENENEEENGEGKRDGTDEKKMEDEEKLPEEVMEEFHPSDDKPSEMPAQPAPESKENEMSSADQVVASEESKQNDSQAQETCQKSEKEPKGVGQAEMEQTKQSHEANVSKKEKLQSGQSVRERERKRERPGKSDEDRCLGDAESQVNKKLKTLDKIEEEKEEKEGVEKEESDLYQHVSERIQEASQVLDAATKDQAENQPIPNKEEEEEGEKPSEEDDLAMDVDEEDIEREEVDKRKSSEMEGQKSSNKNTDNDGDVLTEEVKKQIEGELVQTMNVARGPETTFHTHLPALGQERSLPLHPEEVQALRLKIQEELSAFNRCEMTPLKSIQTWHLLTSVVDGLARDLGEQLRLILEPTQATRLKGDYRTGRRINMRKVISYIASEFRKDSIWLRRTKPWKRDHEIVLAIDDSSSMSHNESKELAFESLALVFKALSLIEAGQLGVLSFGEKTKIVHRPGDSFTDDTGARIIQAFTFEQNKTLVCDMLDVSTCMMSKEKKKEDVARLLMIISDGRGVFSEGVERVKTAVRRATDFGIFVVFVIIDNPKSKDSIMDIRMPEFKDGQFLGIKSYMELFPFPYYVILRDIAALPNTLSDALRQWFQLITASETC